MATKGDGTLVDQQDWDEAQLTIERLKGRMTDLMKRVGSIDNARSDLLEVMMQMTAQRNQLQQEVKLMQEENLARKET